MGISSSLGSSALLPAGLGFRNVLINGDMQIAQRGNSATGLTSGEAIRTVDRFVSAFGTTGTWTETQSTDAPPGFGSSRKFQCTTANASLSAGSYLIWGQNIEGQNLQQFAKGTVSAKPFSLSFWVKAFQTGTYVAELYDNTNTRQVTKTFTINASATWEYKTIQFPADATGAFVNSNANALSLFFWLVAGTNFTSGTATGSWSAASNSNRAVGLNVNGASSTNNYFQFTGVQLEANYQPTPFEQRPFGVELALCQRYFQQFTSTVGDNAFCTGVLYVTTLFLGALSWSPMRAAPIVSFSGSFNLVAAGLANSCTPGSGNITATSCQISGTVTGYPAGNGGTMRMASGAFYSLNAEW